MEINRIERRIQRVRHELKAREVEVASIENSGGFATVVFKGKSLHDFVSGGFDDHVKFMFGNSKGETVRRDYTPRSFDAARAELTIEFALHGDGEAVNWARHAVVGQGAVIGGPRGSMIVPTDYDWHLLVGDATALPAINRRIEELPANTQAIALILVESIEERRELKGQAKTAVHWFEQPQALLKALHALQLPEGEGFSWFGGESALAAGVRKILIDEKHQPKEAMKIAAYWKRGAADFHERLE